MRVPQQSRSRKRVEQILAAARSIIFAKGCAGLKMGDIAEEAGITIGSIYQYFPNKQAIVAALAQHFIDAQFQRFEEALAEPPQTLEELRDIISQVLDGYYQLYRDDPVVRDIWAGSAADKALRDADEAAVTRSVELVFERSKHLFGRSQRAQAKLALRLLMTFAVAAVDSAVEVSSKDGRRVMRTAHTMLEACWAASLLPLASAPASVG